MTQRIIYQSDFPYIVTCNTYYNKQIFNNAAYASIFNKNILYWCDYYKIILYTFCILPNHAHIMFMPAQYQNISLLMMKIKSKTAQDIHFFLVAGHLSRLASQGGSPALWVLSHRASPHTSHRAPLAVRYKA